MRCNKCKSKMKVVSESFDKQNGTQTFNFACEECELNGVCPVCREGKPNAFIALPIKYKEKIGTTKSHMEVCFDCAVKAENIK